MRNEKEYLQIINGCDEGEMRLFVAGFLAALEVNRIYCPMNHEPLMSHTLHSWVTTQILAASRREELDRRSAVRVMVNQTNIDMQAFRSMILDTDRVDDYGNELKPDGTLAGPDDPHRAWRHYAYRDNDTYSIISPQEYGELPPAEREYYRRVNYCLIERDGVQRRLYEDDIELVAIFAEAISRPGDPAGDSFFSRLSEWPRSRQGELAQRLSARRAQILKKSSAAIGTGQKQDTAQINPLEYKEHTDTAPILYAEMKTPDPKKLGLRARITRLVSEWLKQNDYPANEMTSVLAVELVKQILGVLDSAQQDTPDNAQILAPTESPDDFAENLDVAD